MGRNQALVPVIVCLLSLVAFGAQAQIVNDCVNYQIALGGFAGVPGQTVRMPVKFKNQEALAGFLLRVEYDTTLLGPVELGVDENVVWDSLEMVGRGLRTMSIGSRYPGGPIDTVYNTYAIHNPGDDSINAGALFIYFIPLDLMIDQTRPHLPPESGAPTTALHLLFQVREEADPGQTAVIRIRNYDGPLFEPRFVQMVDSVLYRTIIPGSGPEHNRPDDWIIVREAHPALISRALFEEAQRKKALRGRGIGHRTYRCGCGATSSYLLTGLIHCLHCGHRWQGYTSVKGRKRNDGSPVKNYYYACNGYVTKGNSCCQRSVIPKDLIESWVLEQIGQIVHDYLEDGGEAKLRQMIEQEMAGASRFDGSALAATRQRKADIEATIENLIDNITPTNRDFVDRRIEKLRDELVELERQEAALLEQQDKEQHTLIIAQEALAVARSFDRLVKVGTVDEKRVLIRAFLRRIDFDPQERVGKAYFWVVPSVGQEEFFADADSSRPLVSGNTRYTITRNAAQGGISSHSMVAGAGFEPATSGL